MPVEAHLQFLDCPTCARGALFEQPPCGDGHGTDCPEWFCTDCGSAIVLGATVLVTATRPRAAGPAPQTVRAAAAAGRHAA